MSVSRMIQHAGSLKNPPVSPVPRDPRLCVSTRTFGTAVSDSEFSEFSRARENASPRLPPQWTAVEFSAESKARCRLVKPTLADNAGPR